MAVAVADLLQREKATRLPPPAMRAALRRGRFTQDEVAELLGCSRQAVSAYEQGTRRPRGERLLKYAELLRALAEEVA